MSFADNIRNTILQSDPYKNVSKWGSVFGFDLPKQSDYKIKSPIPQNRIMNTPQNISHDQTRRNRGNQAVLGKSQEFQQQPLPVQRREVRPSGPTPIQRAVSAPQRNRAYPDFPNPPREMSRIVDQVFGNLSDKAKLVMFSENATFDPFRDSPPNNNGSIDRGVFQINSDTFNDFMRRKKRELNNLGIYTYEDMFDVKKSALFAKILQKEQGWNWRGPERIGINL